MARRRQLSKSTRGKHTKTGGIHKKKTTRQGNKQAWEKQQKKGYVSLRFIFGNDPHKSLLNQIQ